MKRTKQYQPRSRAGTAALSATLVAFSLLACSAGSTRTGFDDDDVTSTSPNDPNDPNDPAAPGGAAPGADAGDAPEECVRTKPSEACGVSQQCGCADGKTCDVVDAVGNARCVAAGTAPMGHACSVTAGCEAGLTCVFGTCHAFCKDAGQACTQPGTGACVQVKSNEGDDIPNFAVCRIACAPHDPASCGGTNAAGTAVCHVDPDGNTECQSGGSLTEGETCSPSETCGPGLGCVTAEDASTCRRWCRLAEDDCGPGATCTGFSPELVVRGEAYGSCS